MSEWPFKNLVAECITISTPSEIGLRKTGVATVESTATWRAGRMCAISAIAAMSVTVQTGLAGVSVQISLVSAGADRLLHASRLLMST